MNTTIAFLEELLKRLNELTDAVTGYLAYEKGRDFAKRIR